jgi:regulator of telomere elongation helicase 1
VFVLVVFLFSFWPYSKNSNKKVIKELGSTAYRPRMTLQGSRNQLCIHPTVEAAKGPLKSAMCRSLVGSGRCSNYEAVAVHISKKLHVAEVTDIEDLVVAGRRDHVCPYYLARERTKTAEITFLPYNYLIDPLARRHMSEELSGAVLIFDEAHNLDSVCAEASSFDLRDADLAESIESIVSWAKVRQTIFVVVVSFFFFFFEGLSD